MKNKANPMLMTVAVILMLAVSIIYVIDRSVEASPYHSGISTDGVVHPPS